jgi:hypothetical protein
MNKDKALEIALEALELHGKQYPYMVKGYCLDAITAIKKALETKEWVGLTEQEIERTYMDTLNFQQNAKALEAKLKEKNGY